MARMKSCDLWGRDIQVTGAGLAGLPLGIKVLEAMMSDCAISLYHGPSVLVSVQVDNMLGIMKKYNL